VVKRNVELETVSAALLKYRTGLTIRPRREPNDRDPKRIQIPHIALQGYGTGGER
jgi:hypothetical protein